MNPPQQRVDVHADCCTAAMQRLCFDQNPIHPTTAMDGPHKTSYIADRLQQT